MSLRFQRIGFLFVLLLCGASCWAMEDKSGLKQITPAASLPQSTPWNLKALSQPPAVQWGDSLENGVRTLYYTGETYQGKPTRVFAYYATPGLLAGDTSKDKNLPAMVLVHGGGGQAFHKWVELWASRGYAAIAMDLAGNGPGKKRLEDGGPDQGDQTKFDQIEQPLTDQWTYHAVADVILAHSLIRSFPEVDPNRTAITGISWGGYLTCIVSGLDNRFKAAVPVYGCGFLHEHSIWLPRFASMSSENAAKWVKYWDPSMYVGSAAMPMLFVNGGNDLAYPPDSHAKTYALVKTDKNLRFVPNLPHGHIFDRPKAIEVFIESQLKGATPLPKIAKPVVIDGKVTATVDSPTKLVSAKLYYTTQKLPGDPSTRQWIEKPVEIKDNHLTADAVPTGTTIWFLTTTDDRGVLVSSELQFTP